MLSDDERVRDELCRWRREVDVRTTVGPMVWAHLDAGTALPPAFGVGTFITESRVEILPALGIAAAAALYVLGVRRLRARGRRWSPWRTTSFIAGIVALVVATQSGLAAYDTTLFSAHVGQHVLIGVVAPFLMALGAPITLALQASHRSTQVHLLRVLHASPVRALTNPIVAWAVFGLTLFVLYFSPLYELSLRNAFVHELVHLHFLVAGSLFFWAVIGLDPIAWRIPYGFRLLLVLLTVPFHAFLGLALYTGDEPIAGDYYAETARPPAVSALTDQHTGAGVMWIVGDAIGLIAGTVVLAQWMAHEDRSNRRAEDAEDRAAEDRAAAALT
jgi:putative membrane protein